MRNLSFLSLFIFLLSCGSAVENPIYTSDKFLSETDQQQFLNSVIRYMGKLPPKSDHKTKFLPEFDTYYENLAKEHSLDLFYEDPESGTIFFLASRKSPSLYDKRVSIGGELNFDDDGSITYYKEFFRTWKMEPLELTIKSGLLFREMIARNDLAPFYTENSGGEEYIEFPNTYTEFHAEQRQWLSSLLHVTGFER
ncbi:hypothetical protein BH23BAC3_BH23BAC3_06620 [soil metagenome]